MKKFETIFIISKALFGVAQQKNAIIIINESSGSRKSFFQ